MAKKKGQIRAELRNNTKMERKPREYAAGKSVYGGCTTRMRKLEEQ
jgi:hypothetical protein